ncbi:MAG: hypothetical protein CMB80_02925 [Flammeovirgaceae bacterium]|nr:hypothetical protein [Flammeovirgaceae bacterium]
MQLEKGTFYTNITEIDLSKSTRTDMGDLLSLANSIKSIGLINPIILDRNNKLVAGLRRIEAHKILKKEEIECRFYDELTEYERRRIFLEEELLQKKKLEWVEEVALKQALHSLYVADHAGEKRTGRHGKKAWSQSKTASALGVSTSGLSDDLRLAEAMKLFPQLKGIKSKKDALRKMYRLREFSLLERLAELEAEAGETKFKDVEFLNKNCLDVLPTIEDNSVDLIITDPPWGIELTGMQGARSIDYKMFSDKMQGLYTKTIPHFFRILKDGSHIYLFFGIEHYQKLLELLRKAGFDVREVPCVWIKEGPSFSNWEYKPMPQYECFFFAVKSVKGAPKQLKEPASDVFDYKRTKGMDKIHPTEKPIDLIRRLILLSSAKKELVFDPFAGSAATLVASILCDRKCLGIEMDIDYYNAAMARIRNYMVEKELEDE